jgi:hypothetical protein
MRFEFPVRDVETPFGPLPEPVLECGVHTPRGIVPFRFFLDTGADVSIVPASAASFIGMGLDGAASMDIGGIEGGSLRASVSKITLRLGSLDIGVPCLVSSIEETPYLLGRAGIFDRFNVLFDNAGRRIVLESIE